MDASNQNIVIQAVNDHTLTLHVHGELRQVQNEFEEIKRLIQNLNIQNIQYADKIYNIEHINEANFGFLTGKKVVYNRRLTKQLIEAAAKYELPIQNWVAKAQQQSLHWEEERRISDKAKEIIAFSYVGVIGVQFSKLMAIGKENDSQAKPQKYLEKTIHLVKYGLDLLNFTLIAGWWDAQNQFKTGLSAAHQTILGHFFTSGFELSIAQRLTLFETLLQIFETHSIPFPLAELKGFLGEHLGENRPFRKAVVALHQLHERIQKAEDSPLDCPEAESQLATMYAALAFLVRYKMASIRSIRYQQTKQSNPAYLHRYTALGIDSKANIDAEKIYLTPQSAETNSVWIYSGKDYHNGINLMPFALDYNALTFEHGARICFFIAKSAKKFEYVFLDDQSSIQKERETVLGDETSSEWLMVPKNRIISNFNTTIDLLEQLQKRIGVDEDAFAFDF
jgi:hypothetical protein